MMANMPQPILRIPHERVVREKMREVYLACLAGGRTHEEATEIANKAHGGELEDAIERDKRHDELEKRRREVAERQSNGGTVYQRPWWSPPW